MTETEPTDFFRCFKYISFKKIEDKAKTSVWSCRNNKSGSELGVVKWYGPWRQYCYFPTVQAVYSAGCLEDIKVFIKQVGANNAL